MAPQNNSSIIFFASNITVMNVYHMPSKLMTKSIRLAWFVISLVDAGRKKKIIEVGAFDYGPGGKSPLTRGDRTVSRTLLHHPLRPCIHPDSCVRHSLRVESTDARHPGFFHFLLPIKTVFCYILPVLEIYSLHYVYYRFSVLAVYIGTFGTRSKNAMHVSERT